MLQGLGSTLCTCAAWEASPLLQAACFVGLNPSDAGLLWSLFLHNDSWPTGAAPLDSCILVSHSSSAVDHA